MAPKRACVAIVRRAAAQEKYAREGFWQARARSYNPPPKRRCGVAGVLGDRMHTDVSLVIDVLRQIRDRIELHVPNDEPFSL